LGLDWDEGGSKGGAYAPYYQSERTDYYASLFEKMKAQTYPCFCRRADLLAASAPHASDGRVLYAGTCKNLSDQEIKNRLLTQKPAIRLQVPHQNVSFNDGLYGLQSIDLQDFYGDFVLRRTDGTYAYQLAVVADDAAMCITEVVRGNDLLSSTPAQLYLYEVLGLQAPSFTHVPLLMSSKSGERLSKRDGSLSMEALRARGANPQQILGMLAHRVGLLSAEEPVSAKDLIPLYDVNKLPKENITVYSE
jgi:glutamyl-tRNA synthetase